MEHSLPSSILHGDTYFQPRAMEKERLTAELSGSVSLRDFNEIRCGEYAFRSDIPRYDLYSITKLYIML